MHTADPGAIAKAYHHFYIKCPKAFGRYGLIHILTTDWMREFDFIVENNALIIEEKGIIVRPKRALKTYQESLSSVEQC